MTTLRGFWSSRSGALLDRLCPRRGREEEASAPADTLRVRFECEDVPGPSDCVMGREPVDFVIPDDEDSVEDLSKNPMAPTIQTNLTIPTRLCREFPAVSCCS